jgi:hypothetical protein
VNEESQELQEFESWGQVWRRERQAWQEQKEDPEEDQLAQVPLTQILGESRKSGSNLWEDLSGEGNAWNEEEEDCFPHNNRRRRSWNSTFFQSWTLTVANSQLNMARNDATLLVFGGISSFLHIFQEQQGEHLGRRHSSSRDQINIQLNGNQWSHGTNAGSAPQP